MIRRLTILKNLDLFGVPYKTKISINEDEQKSLLGGMITAILYGVSFAYFIYVLIQWQTGNILPVTSSMSKAQKQGSFKINRGELIQFTYSRGSIQEVDPFDNQNIILLPIGYELSNGYQSPPINLLSISNGTSYYDTLLISPDEITIQQNVNASDEEYPVIQFVIVLRSCDEMFLTEGQKCASQDLVNQFWNYGGSYLSVFVKLRQYSVKTQKIEVIDKEIYFPLQNQYNTNGQLLFKPVNLDIDDGILFHNEQKLQFITDIEIITSQTGKSFLNNSFGFDTYISIYIVLDPIALDNRVAYPKLSQILAEVGSISSTLLMIRVFIILFNQHLLEERLINRIIRIHHPFLQLNKVPNDFMKQIKAQSKNKLVITEIINDIYKIQQFIESNFGKSALENSNLKYIESESRHSVKITPIKILIRSASND
ncbi:hypothetical protein pb186bvf_014462 [Paramecium bursaria]